MRFLNSVLAAPLIGAAAGAVACVLGCGGAPPSDTPAAGPQLPPTPTEFVAGKTLYDDSCAACHDVSQESAPRLGFMPAWQRRIDQGIDVMVKHVIEGYHEMPPRGDNPDLTDEEIASIVDYMVYRAELNIPAGYK